MPPRPFTGLLTPPLCSPSLVMEAPSCSPQLIVPPEAAGVGPVGSRGFPDGPQGAAGAVPGPQGWVLSLSRGDPQLCLLESFPISFRKPVPCGFCRVVWSPKWRSLPRCPVPTPTPKAFRRHISCEHCVVCKGSGTCGVGAVHKLRRRNRLGWKSAPREEWG